MESAPSSGADTTASVEGADELHGRSLLVRAAPANGATGSVEGETEVQERMCAAD
jgi:hypothetical protein